MTELSRTSNDLRVLAHNTTFQYKGKAVDVPKVGRDLGARYLLEGSVQRDGDDLRVTAQLIDAETGSHIWADRFDRKMADIFLVQDEIVSQIVAKIAGGYGVIEINEARSARQKTQQEIQAYDLVLRAREVMLWEWNRAHFRSAKEMLLPAIALDPSNIEYIPVLGQLGRKEEALKNWRKLRAEDPGWTAESFQNWYHLFNMRDEDIAKMMDGVYKSGVLQEGAKPD
jgi:adenylate cyclase